ncbi:MAG TPA: DNA-3-methyladenine glycosylase [Candidatus Saccharimonadales bacterium]
MITTIDEALKKRAAEELAKHDPILAAVIARGGLCDIEPHRDYYQALVTEIISQQLAVKAAASIRAKFLALFGGTFPSPETILTKDLEELRTAGLSRAKATYVRDLAEHVVSGRLHFDDLDDLSDADIITKLTDVKGVGTWTAHMFLMFCMGRPDVLPVGDLGIRNGIRKLYGLSSLATPDEMEEIAEKNGWHPYATIASWYVWFSLDNKPEIA